MLLGAIALAALLAACGPGDASGSQDEAPPGWEPCRGRVETTAPAPSGVAALGPWASDRPVTRSARETVLIPDETGAIEQSFTLSPDDRHVAYVTADRRMLVLDGVAQPAFDRIAAPLCFSPNGGHLAYVASLGGKLVVVLDDAPGRSYDGVDTDGPIFSPDGRHLAYWAQEGGKWFVVLDGQELERHDRFLRWSLTFSPDGQRLAYAAADGESTRVIVDGQSGPPRERIALGHPVFSPDSRHVAYVAADRGEVVLSVDGRETAGDWTGFEAASLRFSPDGRHVAFVARVPPPSGLSFSVGEQVKRAAVIDGETGPAYDVVGPPVWSQDGTRVAYPAVRAVLKAGLPPQRDESWVVADGALQGPYEWIGDRSLVFSPDGRLVYKVQDSAGWRVVVDGVRGTTYDDIGTGAPALAPTGSRLAYGAKRDGRWFVVVDSNASDGYDGIGEGTPIFSPDGSRTAFDAGAGGRWAVVVDGTPWPDRYDVTMRGTPLFSPDSRHVLSAVRQGSADMVVVDGQPGRTYDTVVPYTGRIRFDEPDRFHYIAIRGKTWYLVEETLQ